MANNFLTGLSEGIFGRLGEVRQEQESKDTAQEQQLITLLSSMADRVEPESLPLLMGHLGDVIGIKGKMRGFWDAFSGMPNRTVEDQLGSKLREITGGFTGADTARTMRKEAKDQWAQGQWLTGQMPTDASYPNQIPVGLQGKMVFRDPRQEKAEETERKYTYEMEKMQKRLDQTLQDKLKVMEEAQVYRKDLEDTKEQNRINRAINARAAILAGGGPVTQQHKEAAAIALGQDEMWKGEKIQAQILGLRAEAEKDRMESALLKQNQGLTPAQARTIPIQERRERRDIETNQKTSTAMETEAQTELNSLKEKIFSVVNKYPDRLRFNHETGILQTKKGKPGDERGDLLLQGTLKLAGMDKMVSDYAKLLGNRNKAREQKAAFEKQLKELDIQTGTPTETEQFKRGEVLTIPLSGTPQAGKIHVLPDGTKVKVIGRKGRDGAGRGVFEVQVLGKL